MVLPNVPIVNAGELYVNGIQMSWLASTPSLNLPTVQLSPGSCRDSLNINDIVLPNTAVIALNKYGANGVDINAYNPSTPNKLYNNAYYVIYVIADSTEYQPTAAFMSLAWDPNPPHVPLVTGSITLPLGYDMYRRIGYVYTDNSLTPVIYGFTQYGTSNARDYWYFNLLKAFQYNATAGPTTFTATPFSQGIPLGPNAFQAWLLVQYTPTASTNFLQFSPYDAFPDPLSTTATGMIKFGIGATQQNAVLFVPTSPDPTMNPSVWYMSTGLDDAVTVSVIGYKDYI